MQEDALIFEDVSAEVDDSTPGIARDELRTMPGFTIVLRATGSQVKQWMTMVGMTKMCRTMKNCQQVTVRCANYIGMRRVPFLVAIDCYVIDYVPAHCFHIG